MNRNLHWLMALATFGAHFGVACGPMDVHAGLDDGEGGAGSRHDAAAADGATHESGTTSCTLGTEGCGCNALGACNSGLACFAQPAPINGVCLVDQEGGKDGGGLSCEPAFLEAGTGLAGDAEIPIYHRATPSCCPSERSPGPPTQPYGPGVASPGGCTSDSQCTSGADGRCFPFEGLVGPGGCSYDQCFTDSDCPSGAPCVCRTSASDNSANVCAPGGNCVLDSDCGPGGYCSPSMACNGTLTYYCHTASDTCINDADCPFIDAGAGCQIPLTCVYGPQTQHWACSDEVCCPP
jgi:hypothetical protein